MILDAHPFHVNTKGHLEIGGVDTIELAKSMEHLYMSMMLK